MHKAHSQTLAKFKKKKTRIIKTPKTIFMIFKLIKIFFKYEYCFNNLLYEPRHAKTCLMPYANNKGADQPAHPRSLISAFVRSLISAFVVRCLDSRISLVSIFKLSSL